MKRLVAFLLTVILLCSLMSVTSFAAAKNTTAKNAVTVGNEEMTDNLPNKKAERWYKFENKTKGDVVVYLTNTDNIDNIWRVSLFDSPEAERELSYNTYCDGTSDSLSYEGLNAGTYYLRITIGSSYNKDSYDNLNYTVRVKTLSDVKVTASENGVYVFTKAGEDMFVLDGHIYTKRSDGTTIVGRGYNHNGEPYIMLVGMTEDDIKYDTTAVYSNTLDMDYWVTYEDDKTYPYLTIRTGTRQLHTDLYVCNGGERTTDAEDNAFELLNIYNGKGGDEGKDSLWRHLQKDYGPLLMIGIGLVGVFIVIAGVVIIAGLFSEKKKKTHTYVSSDRSDYVDNTPTATTTSTAEMMDMDIAKQIINNIGGTDGI